MDILKDETTWNQYILSFSFFESTHIWKLGKCENYIRCGTQQKDAVRTHKQWSSHSGDKPTLTHHVAEDEAGVREFEVFEEAVEFAAVQGAPGAVKVVSRLRLLPGVVVVQKLYEEHS